MTDLPKKKKCQKDWAVKFLIVNSQIPFNIYSVASCLSVTWLFTEVIDLLYNRNITKFVLKFSKKKSVYLSQESLINIIQCISFPTVCPS